MNLRKQRGNQKKPWPNLQTGEQRRTALFGVMKSASFKTGGVEPGRMEVREGFPFTSKNRFKSPNQSIQTANEGSEFSRASSPPRTPSRFGPCAMCPCSKSRENNTNNLHLEVWGCQHHGKDVVYQVTNQPRSSSREVRIRLPFLCSLFL